MKDAVPNDLFRQKTIARSVAIAGVGIHTGSRVQMKLLPAPEYFGLRFRRIDSGGVEIPALASSVTSLEMATTLGRDDIVVSTVEHLLAAARGLDIDNLLVELDGPEVPILDGSALPYYRLLQAAGIRQQNALRRIMAITAPLTVELEGNGGGKVIRISPYPGVRVSYTIDFPDSVIGRQSIDLELDPTVFERELAPARTFSLLTDVQRLQRCGLGRGGDVDNCVIFDDNGPINTPLRFDNEPVRHKALDVLGDLALLGTPLWGHVEAECGGHQLHYSLLEALQGETSCWTWMLGEVSHLNREIQRAPQPHAIPSALAADL